MQNVVTSDPGLSPAQHLLFQAETRSSRLYQCPLYVWAAHGRRCVPNGKTEPQLRLYIEYRDRFKRCRYSQFQFPSLEALDHFLEQELTTTSLHEIHPDNTLAYPIDRAIKMHY